MPLEVVLLGTGNPLPDPRRAGPAILVRTPDRCFLFDAGRGVCMRMAAIGVLPPMLDAVFLTHLHSDHICDLNDLITTQWIMGQHPQALVVIGPSGTPAVVSGILTMLAADISFRRAHHDDLNWDPIVDVQEIIPGTVFEDATVRVVAAASDHRPVDPSFAFRIEHDGASVVVGGDSVPCPGLDALCRGADIYIQTVLRDDLVRTVPIRRFQETIDYHSTVAQAAKTSAQAGVGTLVLTHQVPSPPPEAADEWKAIAAQHFSGRVLFAEDLTIVTTGDQ